MIKKYALVAGLFLGAQFLHAPREAVTAFRAHQKSLNGRLRNQAVLGAPVGAAARFRSEISRGRGTPIRLGRRLQTCVRRGAPLAHDAASTPLINSFLFNSLSQKVKTQELSMAERLLFIRVSGADYVKSCLGLLGEVEVPLLHSLTPAILGTNGFACSLLIAELERVKTTRPLILGEQALLAKLIAIELSVRGACLSRSLLPHA